MPDATDDFLYCDARTLQPPQAGLSTATLLASSLEVVAEPAMRTPATLVVLTKAPGSGHVKTRLATSVGEATAAALAAAFLEDTLTTAAKGPWRMQIAITPREALAEVRRLCPGLGAFVQAEGDLGDRILAALAQALSTSQRVVLIGSDTPDLPAELVGRAFAALDSHDLVLGPAYDGGFYLIGCQAVHHEVFEGVVWSTSSVLARVLANVNGLKLTVDCLDPWEDVDDLPSLRALARRLAAAPGSPATRRALADVSAACWGVPHDDVTENSPRPPLGATGMFEGRQA